MSKKSSDSSSSLSQLNERVEQLHDAYKRVWASANARLGQLNEAQRYWQFVEDSGEVELWFNEKIQQLSVSGDDVSVLTVQMVCDEALAHRKLQYEKLIERATALVDAQNHAHEQIGVRLAQLEAKSDELAALIAAKKQRLEHIAQVKQWLADADDCDSHLFELVRMLTQSADDDDERALARDEAAVLNLLKKHRELEDDFLVQRGVCATIGEQAAALPSLSSSSSSGGVEKDDDGEEEEEGARDQQVKQRLNSLERRQAELGEMLKMRRARLGDHLSFLRLQADTDGVEEWIDEKERFLATLEPSNVKDIEALEVIKHRFDGFEREMNLNAPKVALVNQLARQLVQQQSRLNSAEPSAETSDLIDSDAQQQRGGGPQSSLALSVKQVVAERINKLNGKWSALRSLVDKKRDELNSTFGVQTFHIESKETVSWIQDKIRVVAETASLGNDLAGVMQMQRRLGGLERDLAAINAKREQLSAQANALEHEHPEETREIRSRLDEIAGVWLELKELLQAREERMGEAADLHKFLRDLDHFSAWLTRTQTQVASGSVVTDATTPA